MLLARFSLSLARYSIWFCALARPKLTPSLGAKPRLASIRAEKEKVEAEKDKADAERAAAEAKKKADEAAGLAAQRQKAAAVAVAASRDERNGGR